MTKLYIMLTIAVAMLVAGCTKKIYVPTEDTRVVRDTVYKTLTHRDSVIHRDSVYIYQRGDTIEKTTLKERTRIICCYDTLLQIVHDTIVQKSVTPISSESKSGKSFSIWKLLTATIMIIAGIYVTKTFHK